MGGSCVQTLLFQGVSPEDWLVSCQSKSPLGCGTVQLLQGGGGGGGEMPLLPPPSPGKGTSDPCISTPRLPKKLRIAPVSWSSAEASTV